MRVVAALSGGVDSAVAAARAVAAGHDVVGVHLALATNAPAPATGRSKGCCSLDDARDARRVADVLGIPFYVWDLSDQFQADVIDDFVAEYEAGRTPNPCLRCNERIKFAAVLDRALGLGFDAVATGHYARIATGEHGPELHRAADPLKDQSYVLGVLDADQIAHSMFPLGNDVKDEVRREAAERGLLVAEKPDSHDVCFITDGRTGDFLAARLGDRPGPIVDAETGEAVGEHRGAYTYTIGQRRGLALTRPRADGAPRYVVGVEPATATVLVGTEELLQIDRIEGSNPVWSGVPAVDGARVGVQVRAHGRETPASVRFTDSGVVLELDEPERGVAPGQAAVLYDGTRVVGSVTITSTSRARARAN